MKKNNKYILLCYITVAILDKKHSFKNLETLTINIRIVLVKNKIMTESHLLSIKQLEILKENKEIIINDIHGNEIKLERTVNIIYNTILDLYNIIQIETINKKIQSIFLLIIEEKNTKYFFCRNTKNKYCKYNYQ